MNGSRCTQFIQFRSNTCLGFDKEYFVIQRFWWWKYVVGHISVVYTKYMIEESIDVDLSPHEEMGSLRRYSTMDVMHSKVREVERLDQDNVTKLLGYRRYRIAAGSA